MTRLEKLDRMLFVNLFLFALSLAVSYASKVPVALFCSLHAIVLFFFLRRDLSKILSIKKISSIISLFVLLNAILMFFGSIYIMSGVKQFLYVSILFKLLINGLFILFACGEILKFMKNESSYLIILELFLVGLIISIFLATGVFPLATIETDSFLILTFFRFMNVFDYFLLLICLSMSSFLFNYQKKYLFGYSYPIIFVFFSLSFILSNIYLCLGRFDSYDIMTSLFMFFLLLYRRVTVSYITNPIAEIMNDADADYKIEIVKNSKVVYLIFVLCNTSFILYLLGIFSTKLYSYLVFTLLGYIVASLLANKMIVERLLINKEDLSKRRMKEIINKRNKELLNMNAKLEHAVSHHRSTMLPNRFSFVNEVGDIIDKGEESFSMILISLENIREFRNLYGIDKSLKLMLSFLDRLDSYIQRGDFIYQLSNNEIALITLSDQKNRKNLNFFEDFYKSLYYLSDIEYNIDGIIHYLKLKIAFVRYPEDVKSLKELFVVSDLMSFKYTRDGKLLANMKTAEKLIASMRSKNMYSTMLKEADYDAEFMLYYQPQFDIHTKQVIGAEALLRWKRGDDFIPPNIFIPIAESIGLIYNISVWVSKQAIKQREKWKALFGDAFKIGINVSPLILDSNNFFVEFANELGKHEVEYHDFDFEITEHSELANSPKALYILDHIKSQGISISIDDFGTGYSSLEYVRMFKTDKIKIAKELVDEILVNEEYKYMIEGIIKMAETLNMKTIAEGVEDENQLEVLRGLACDELQGYIWGRPVPAMEFEKLYMQAK